jgi:DNA-binding NarL/FixJ family response regulator
MSGGRAVVADDDVLVREGIASILVRAGYEVVAEAGDATTLEGAAREHEPDVVVTDIRMPPTHTSEGLDVSRTLRADYPGLAVLVLSAHVEVEEAIDLLQTGSRIGYLLKSRVLKPDDLVDAIERVRAGGSVIDPELVQELVAKQHREDPLEALSPREREVLAQMAEGRSNAGIASRLFISEGAVEKHVRSILGKLRLPTSDDDHRRVLAVLRFLDAS